MTAAKLGKQIRAARLESGLTIAALASRLDVRPNTVHRWEAGYFAPDVLTFRALALALRTSADALLGIER